MSVLTGLHLVGAALWLGGLVTLALAVLVALRTLPPELFRAFVRRTGWAFAGLSALAWLLIAVPGLLLAGQLGWPSLVRVKAALGGVVLLAAALHVLTGRLTASQPAVLTSRALAALVLAGTAAAFWLGVQASGQ
jgi:uncharacterized membrane protein